jgi:hypothetical protein
MKASKYEKILIHTVKHSGGTFTTDGNIHEGRGWYIGTEGVKVKADNILAQSVLNDLADAIDYVSYLIEQSGNDGFIGTWLDKKGTIHVDLTVHEMNVKNAIAIATYHEQEAIYNASTGETLYMKDLKTIFTFQGGYLK